MSQSSKKKTTVLIIVACVAAIALARWVVLKSGPADSSVPSAKTKGDPDAPVKIIEYIDFQCPACAQGSIFLGKYIEQYPERIYLRMKYFPLGHIHDHAYQSAMYAECAARQDRFWPYHDRLLERQRQWRSLDDAEPIFRDMAAEVGLDMERLSSCLDKNSVMALITAEKEEGQSRGVKSTPTYFINGEMVVGTRELAKELKSHFGSEF